jgi:S1-C subfamily serine protease
MRHPLLCLVWILLLTSAACAGETDQIGVRFKKAEKDARSLVILDVVRDGFGAKLGLRGDDVILSVNEKALRTIDQWEAAIRNNSRPVIKVRRGSAEQVIRAAVAWPSDKAPKDTVIKVDPSRRPPTVLWSKTSDR